MQATSGQTVSVTGIVKDTKDQVHRQQYPRLFCLLDAVPFHAFSETGRANICRRFSVSDEELERCLLVYQHPGAPATEAERRALDMAALLHVISEAVTPPTKRGNRKAPTKKAKGGAAPC